MAVPEGYTEVGLIGLVNKGNYDPLTEYSKYNFVYYQGSTYLYINELPQSGVTPSDDGVTWQYMSRGMIMDNTPTQGSPNAVTSGGIYDSERALKTEIQNEQTAATTKATDTNNVLGQGTVTNATNVQALLDNVTDKDTNPTKDSAKTVKSGGVYSADKATREMIAPVEENAVSSAPYAIGEQLIFNGVLCEATSAISIGDTLALGTNLSAANKITNRDSTPTANSTKLVTSGGVYSADNQIRENIANVEGATSAHPYTVGKQLIFNGLLCKATSAISVGDTLAVGTNLALSDNVVEQIYSLNQGLTNSLSNEIATRAKVSGHNIGKIAKPSRTGLTGLDFTVNSDGSVTVNGTSTAAWSFIMNDAMLLKAGSYTLSSGIGANPNLYVQITNENQSASIASTQNSAEKTFTLNVDTIVVYRLFYLSGQTFNNVVVKPMIRLATDESADYEPYSMTNREMTPYVQAISNPNLLDNPWFTVNQRGNNTYSESGYSVDRWQRNPSYGNGHKFTVGTIEIPYLKGDFYQVIETAMNHWRHVPYTVSAIIDGNLYSKTFTPYDDGQQHMGSAAWGSTSIGLDGLTWNIIENWSSSTHLVGINNNGALQNHTITAIKLELGSVSTLAMDTAPNYQQELAKCQRYFVRFGSNESVPAYTYNFGMAYEVNSSSAYFNVMIPIPMRSTPLISYQGSWAIGSKALNNITVDSMFNNIVKLVCTTSQTFTAGEVELLENKEAGTSYIDFTSDL